MDDRIKIFWENFEKIYVQENELPSFTMIFQNLEILSFAHNLVEKEKNTNYHSEILAIDLAIQKQKNKFLENSILLTTLEPCLMCAGAILLARISEVWYFAEQTKQQGISSFTLETIYKLNHFPKLRFIQDKKIENTWKKFFQQIRKNKFFLKN